MPIFDRWGARSHEGEWLRELRSTFPEWVRVLSRHSQPPFALQLIATRHAAPSHWAAFALHSQRGLQC